MAGERIDGLIESLSAKKAKVIIPTPALAEILMAGQHTAQKYIETLKGFSCFQIRAFDERAAIELAANSASPKRGIGSVSKTSHRGTRLSSTVRSWLSPRLKA